MQKLIYQTLQDLGKSFPEGDLAYLALTSKSENTIRDLLAIHLHNRIAGKGLKVAREWRRRFDLAILDADCNAACLLEVKFYLSADLMSEKCSHIVDISLQADAEKLRNFPGSVDERLQLLLIAHPKISPAKEQDSYIKYGRLLRTSPVKSKQALLKSIKKYSKNGKVGVWDAGEAFGIPVEIHFMLYEAVR